MLIKEFAPTLDEALGQILPKEITQSNINIYQVSFISSNCIV
jgi:hypothetical protein